MIAKLGQVRERKFGPEDSDRLTYMLELAAIYQAEQKFDQAEPIAAELVDIRRKLGPRQKETIMSMILLSDIYDKRQKMAQGLSIISSAYESSRLVLGENDALTLQAKFMKQAFELKTRSASGDRPSRAEILENAARAVERYKPTSLPEMIKLAGQRATIAVNQGKPQDAEAPLVEAIEAARRAGQEELNLTAILAGVYALQTKWDAAETTMQKVLVKPSKDFDPNVLPFALRSLGVAYRNAGKFAEAEPHLARLLPIVLVAPGERNVQTRIDMFLYAETLTSLQKYANAEKTFSQLLDIQRRVSGPEVINTVITVTNVGWTRLQQRRFADAEQTFREAAVILGRTTPDAWERFNNDSMLGAALSGQRKFEEAEPLLISGYNGMGSRKPSTNQAVVSRFTRDQAGAAIVQFYTDWGKPDLRDEWARKIAQN